MSTTQRRTLPRRQFVKTSTASVLGASLLPQYLAAQAQAANIQELELWSPAGSDQFDYPAPRYPKHLPKITDVEQLLPMARRLAEEPPRLGISHLPGYGINPGQKALIITASNVDPLPGEAITIALRERGILVDHMSNDVGLADASRLPSPDGTSAPAENEGRGTVMSLRDPHPQPRGGRWYVNLARQMNYTLVIEGTGGALLYTTEGITDFYHQHILWPHRDNFFVRT